MTIEEGFSAARRIDTITVAAIVLTVDAVVFLLVAILGVPALAWLFGDELASWSGLWQVVLVWVIACVLGPLCTAATMRVTGRGNYSIRRTGTAAAAGTAVVTGALAVVSAASSPGLAVLAALFAAANVGAARVFVKAPEDSSPETDRMLAVPLAEPFTESDVAGEDEALQEIDDEADFRDLEPKEAEARPTIDLAPVLHIRRRNRSRGPAALRTLAGVQLPPRARRR
ncbi:hypothetical protein [Actinoplanes sp. GCM10030250]|uniref:hypothetical protein n=1 Tax=Actinoplanes sp. GCM10030250 TaxID=3273376 RepID=UPI003621E159